MCGSGGVYCTGWACRYCYIRLSHCYVIFLIRSSTQLAWLTFGNSCRMDQIWTLDLTRRIPNQISKITRLATTESAIGSTSRRRNSSVSKEGLQWGKCTGNSLTFKLGDLRFERNALIRMDCLDRINNWMYNKCSIHWKQGSHRIRSKNLIE